MYTQISLKDMKNWLHTLYEDWSEVLYEDFSEFVFDRILNHTPNIVCRVFTSVSKFNGKARKKGVDAIRVCAVDTTNKKGYIKTVKVLRVRTWKLNLRRAIEDVEVQVRNRLKEEPSEPKPKIWTCHEGEWLVEASTLDANRDTHPRNKCPECESYFSAKNIIETMTHKLDYTRKDKVVDSSIEIDGWKIKCPGCKKILMILND